MLGASRRALLVAALGFGCCRGVRAGSGLDPTLEIFRTWLSGWRGVGLIAAGMARQGYDLSLTRYAELGWRATFYVSGSEHSPTGAAASAFDAPPVRAGHVGAWGE